MAQRKSKFRMDKLASSKSKQNSANNNLAISGDIIHLKLSPESQTYAQCRIGQQIFGNTNWVLIPKTAILASIEFSDDFLPAIELVREYPEDKLLIGSYGFDQNISEAFQLCTTVICKNNILNILEQRQTRIAQIYNMPIYAWSSLGSETEIDETQNQNLRSLLVVEISSLFPIFVGRRVFKIRNADDSMYMECLTSRHEYKNVWKKRIDAACQARLSQIDAYVQTRTSTDLRHSTQYKQQIYVQTPNNKILDKIAKFLDLHLDEVEDLLRINYYIHFHANDYMEFLNPYIGHIYTNYKEIIACQDIKRCQRKQVSCVSWNPFISGLFAASYVRTDFDHIFKTEPIFVNTETFDEHLTLLWSISDMQKPKLYLHSFREVTTISFCPYDENILVGGCSNGQIVIWDITGHLNKVENKVIYSPVERRNHAQIEHLNLWMKNLPSIEHVNACVFSSLSHGHKTAITNITWIPPEYYISRTGQLSNSLEKNTQMQFVTSGLEDDNICVWDLKHNKTVTKPTRRKPLHRLNKLPAALRKDDSPLKNKFQHFIPIYILFIRDSITHKPLFIRSLLFKHHEYQYNIFKSVNVDNNFKRKYFTLCPPETFPEWDQTFVVNTVSGVLHDCSWEGFSYDHGNQINSDTCSIKSYVSIHDAPITMCITNRDEPNIQLSIGGRVFAIWHKKQPHPLLWRKCASSYIFGNWSYVHPFEILLSTNDGFIQLWNFIANSKYPIYTARSHGLPPVGIFSNIGVEHYMKNAILLLDRFGAIRIHAADSNLTTSISSFESVEVIKSYIENKKQICSGVSYWCNRFKKMQTSVVEMLKEEVEQPEVFFETVTTKEKEASKKEEFEIKQHQYMYKQLTEKKGIHIEQLEMNRKILNEVIIQSKELGRKCAQVLSNKVELFEKKKQIIAWNITKLERKIFKISLPKEYANKLKKQYFEEYLIMEKIFSSKMKEYIFVGNWNEILEGRLTTDSSVRNLSIFRNHEKTMKNQAFKYNFRETILFKTVDLYDN